MDKVMAEQGSVLRPYEIPYQDLEFGEEDVLGAGAFGTVYKGMLRGKTDVAIKTMRISKITERELTNFKKELIVRLLDCIP